MSAARPLSALAGLLVLVGSARAAPAPSNALLRQWVAQTALAQLEAADPSWSLSQRDCAGLVRFAYRAAYRRLRPGRLETPLWVDGAGKPSDFADAETLLAKSFQLLGRGEQARLALESGDLVAFRQTGGDGAPVYHLMLVAKSADPAHASPRVVYHPGAAGEAVRSGRLDQLVDEAPVEWKPVPQNSAFLGFFRFQEWIK